MMEVVFPKFLGTFESSLEQNGGKYLVGDSVSYIGQQNLH